MATKYALSSLALDEVSFVDTPANRLAKVVLFKRAAQQPVIKGPEGIRLHVGFTDTGESEIQSVSFDLAKWDSSKAEAWMKERALPLCGVIEKKDNNLRILCKYASEFKRLRVMVPGGQLSKTLNGENSYNAIQTAVDAALREMYQGKDPAPGHYLWIRDLFQDNVVFDQDGEIWRAPFTITNSPTGEMQVGIGPKTCVDLQYVDETAEPVETAKKETVPAELIFKLGQLQARQKFLDRKVHNLENGDSRFKR